MVASYPKVIIGRYALLKLGVPEGIVQLWVHTSLRIAEVRLGCTRKYDCS